MVAKITTGNDLYGALAYNQEKVDKEKGKVLSTHIVREPADGKFSVPAAMEDFLRWMQVASCVFCCNFQFLLQKTLAHKGEEKPDSEVVRLMGLRFTASQGIGIL